MRQLRRLREKDLLYHKVVKAAQEPRDFVPIRVALHRILTSAQQRGDLAVLHRVQHLGEVLAVRRLNRHTPVTFKGGAHRRVENVLKAGQAIGNRTHVAAALHIVLPTQRVTAAGPTTDMTGEQAEIDQRQHVVDGVVMLGNAERPTDHRLVRCGEGVRGFANRGGGNPGELFTHVERVRFDRRAVRVKARRPICNERCVRQPRTNNFARHRIRQRHVGPHVEPHPHVRPLGRIGAARIHHVEARPIAHAFQQMMKPNRVRGARVRSPEKDDVRFFHFRV